VSRLTTWLPPDVYSDTVKLILDYMRYEHPERSRAELVVDLINAIESKPSTDPVYGQAADWFRQKIFLADRYTGKSTDLFNLLTPIVSHFDIRIPDLAVDFVRGADVLDKSKFRSNLLSGQIERIVGEYVIDKAGPRDSVAIQNDSIFYVTTDGMNSRQKEQSGRTTPNLTIDGERYLTSYDLLQPNTSNLAAYLDERFVGTTTPDDDALIVINYVIRFDHLVCLSLQNQCECHE